MREVNKNQTNQSEIYSGTHSILSYFFYFLRSPIKRIQLYPDFPVNKVIVLQIFFQLIILGISASISDFKIPLIIKVILLPILVLVFHYLLSLMTHIYFQITENKRLKFSKLWGLLFFCLVPVHLASLFSTHVPAISVVFFITSLFLIITGLVANFSVNRKGAVIYAIGLFILYLVVFITQHKISLSA